MSGGKYEGGGERREGRFKTRGRLRWRRDILFSDAQPCQLSARGVMFSAPTTMSQQAIIHAYRHLYRHSLRAIQFSKPARFTLRDRLRLAFRRGYASDFEPQKVQNTIEFLQYAAKENGLEHKILKNLLFVWWVQGNGGRTKHRAKNLYVPCLSMPSTRRLTCQNSRGTRDKDDSIRCLQS